MRKVLNLYAFSGNILWIYGSILQLSVVFWL